MAKQPKPLDKMTKAQLVVALKKAYKRIAKLELNALPGNVERSLTGDGYHFTEPANAPTVFPWQQVLNDTKGL